MPHKTTAKLAKRARPDEVVRATAISQVADDVERLVQLGERVVGAVGGASLLVRAGADKILAPVMRRALEDQIRDLERENGYMREALLVVVDRDGPLLVDRPTDKGRLAITVDVRQRTIDIRREGT